MRDFANLYRRLDQTTSLNDKTEALVSYFLRAKPGDAAWTVAIFAGQRPKKPVNRRLLQDTIKEYLSIDDWMLEESYALVGDLGETFALMIDTLKPDRTRDGDKEQHTLQEWMEKKLPQLARSSDDERKALLMTWWSALSSSEIFVLQKLIGGSLRVGASKSLLIRALSTAADVPISVMTERLTGKWLPTEEFYRSLMAPADGTVAVSSSQPYPFALAYPLERAPEDLGPIDEWVAEWKWDGIRSQIVCRSGECHIWSRGEDLITDSFPDIAGPALEVFASGTVLDGELLVFDEDGARPFADLQKRLGRKAPGQATLKKFPVNFLAYDLLELAGEDLRKKPYHERRARLEDLMRTQVPPFRTSPLLVPRDWQGLQDARAVAREQKVEGLMLKRKDAPYRAGRRKGDWWKWKVDPLTIDAVLLYAQAGSGRRANLFTDYTFGVWNDEGILIPVAKAYSGLNQEEIAELDRWIRSHTKEKFGPVRSVELEHVFEIGFEGIQESGRHKAGVALRFPRILRWRRDKPAQEADRLDTVKALLHAH